MTVSGHLALFEQTKEVYAVSGSHGIVKLVTKLESGALIPHHCNNPQFVGTPFITNLGGASVIADDDVGTEPLVDGAGEVA